LKIAMCLPLAALLILPGCGKEEHAEGARLAKILTQKQPDFAKANSVEQDFVASAKAWCAGIVANGAGRGAELDQNAAVAGQLAKNLVEVSNALSEVRQPVADASLQKDFPKEIRAGLITQLTSRQRRLQEMRVMMEQSATQFTEYKNSRAYKGDTYPDGISKMDLMLKSYKPPEDIVGAALAELKSKYNFAAGEI
jgi:hypothetical protein